MSHRQRWGGKGHYCDFPLNLSFQDKTLGLAQNLILHAWLCVCARVCVGVISLTLPTKHHTGRANHSSTKPSSEGLLSTNILKTRAHKMISSLVIMSFRSSLYQVNDVQQKKEKRQTSMYIHTIDVYYLGFQIPYNKLTMTALTTKHRTFDTGPSLLYTV